MKGHEALTAMRRAGWRPATVNLDLAPHWQRFWRDWHERMPAHAQIFVEPDDVVERLDLRFLIGLTVTVQGDDAARVGRLAQSCVKAGAARVMAHSGHWLNRDTYATDHMALTNEECMQWPL